ncbi:N-acetylmuramoyl-L-alanine amidase [Marinilabiliaceae bacterium JC040]|nr:N-acetylmuramoyl-L-alanine amidase [Marinilabiliaceae bacterium JC040]
MIPKTIKINTLLLFLLLIVSSNNFILKAQNGTRHLRVVCIDPGHGGRDPGAITKGLYEKELVLDVGLRLGNLIKKNFKDVKVFYTRNKDKSVGLYERAQFANDKHADLYISIHANSASSRAYGTETFVFGLNKTESNLEVSMKENSVIEYEKDSDVKYKGFDPRKPESYIMFNMVQNHHREQSIEFANLVEKEFKRSRRKSRGVQESSLIVLIKAAMPAVLIEVGFITNKKEKQYLKSKRGRGIIAKNIFNAFKKYKQSLETENVLINYPNKKSIKKNSTRKILKKKTNETYWGVQLASSVDRFSKREMKKYQKYGKIKEIKIGRSYKYILKIDGNIKKAINLQNKLSRKFKGCFVVAIQNNRRISVKAAKKIIK